MIAVQAAIVNIILSVSGLMGMFEHTAYNKSPIKDRQCSSMPLTHFGQTKNFLSCGEMCGRTDFCNSFYFNVINKACQGSSRVYNDTALSGCTFVAGTHYYSEAPSSEGKSCTEDEDCYGMHEECRDSTCACEAGYSLQPELKACKRGCLVFGDTFTVIPGHSMVLDDSPGSPLGTSLADCKALCAGDNNCRTMRYNVGASACKTDPRTPLTNPENYTVYPSLNLYMRNCAEV